MPRFNPDKITKLISEMRKSADRLRALQSLGKESFLSDPDKIGSAKYHLIVSIEAAIDISGHIISQNGYRTPEDYADTFQVLAEKNVIAIDFANDLKEMSKFRNRLVHLYWEVDDEIVFEIVQKRLNDFKTFLNKIAIFLELDKL